MNYEQFNEVTIAPVSKETARQMIVNNHYSHKWANPFGVENYGVFRDGELLGVAVYGYAMNPKGWGKITSLDPSVCLELNRLWISDDLGPNTETWFISKTMKELKNKGYRLIQSFADGRLGVGTIYQAANFGYYGLHKTLFHRDSLTMELMHDVPFNDTRSATGMISRNLLHAEKRLASFKVATYRYLYPLDRGALKSLLVEEKPYPKERLGMEEMEDYLPPLTQVARSAALAEAIEDAASATILREYLSKISDSPDLLIETQHNNDLVRHHAMRHQSVKTLVKE